MAIPADFPAAVVAALQANVACATAFNSTPQNPKFFGVYAMRQAPSPNTLPSNSAANTQLPYARILEVQSTDSFQSIGSDGLTCYFERGELQVDVFDTSESGARAKAKLIAAVLNDGNLTFADGSLMECRQSHGIVFIPEPDSGVGGAGIVYHAMIIFLTMIQRNL